MSAMQSASAQTGLARAEADLAQCRQAYAAAKQTASENLGNLFTGTILADLEANPAGYAQHDIPAVARAAQAKAAVDTAEEALEAAKRTVTDAAEFTSLVDIKQLMDGMMGDIAGMFEQMDARLGEVEQRVCTMSEMVVKSSILGAPIKLNATNSGEDSIKWRYSGEWALAPHVRGFKVQQKRDTGQWEDAASVPPGTLAFDAPKGCSTVDMRVGEIGTSVVTGWSNVVALKKHSGKWVYQPGAAVVSRVACDAAHRALPALD
jgi:hypothetical protein